MRPFAAIRRAPLPLWHWNIAGARRTAAARLPPNGLRCQPRRRSRQQPHDDPQRYVDRKVVGEVYARIAYYGGSDEYQRREPPPPHSGNGRDAQRRHRGGMRRDGAVTPAVAHRMHKPLEFGRVHGPQPRRKRRPEPAEKARMLEYASPRAAAAAAANNSSARHPPRRHTSHSIRI